MDLPSATRLLLRNPDIFIRKAAGRLLRSLPGPARPARRRIGGVSLEIPAGRDPSLRLMRLGLYEPETAAILRSRLPRGGTFVDAGANIGYLSAVAADAAGQEGVVVAFEPVPAHADRLRALAASNPRHRIIVRGTALGHEEGTATIRIGAGPNIGWSTLVPGLMKPTDRWTEVEVPVERMDRACEREGISRVDLIKVDAEGYELPVLLGAREILERHRPGIICEVTPKAYAHLGRRIDDLFSYLASFGYEARLLPGGPGPIGPEAVRRRTDLLFEAPSRRPEVLAATRRRML